MPVWMAQALLTAVLAGVVTLVVTLAASRVRSVLDFFEAMNEFHTHLGNVLDARYVRFKELQLDGVPGEVPTCVDDHIELARKWRVLDSKRKAHFRRSDELSRYMGESWLLLACIKQALDEDGLSPRYEMENLFEPWHSMRRVEFRELFPKAQTNVVLTWFSFGIIGVILVLSR